MKNYTIRTSFGTYDWFDYLEQLHDFRIMSIKSSYLKVLKRIKKRVCRRLPTDIDLDRLFDLDEYIQTIENINEDDIYTISCYIEEHPKISSPQLKKMMKKVVYSGMINHDS